MPFDPNKYLEKKSAFNPDAYLSKASKPSQTESLLRGAAQGLSMQYADEIAGALGAAKHALKTGEISPETYRKERDIYRAADEEARQENPKTFLASEVAAGMLPTLAPGIGGVSAGKAALQGALMGLGGSKSDLTKGDISDAAIDTSVGGLLGAGLGKLGGSGTNLPNSLKQKAVQDAVAATGATRAEAEKFAKDAGEQLLKRGLIKMGDSPKSIAKRLAIAEEEATKGINNALKEASYKKVTATTEDALGAVDRKIADLKSGGAGHADQVRQLEKIKEDLAESLGKGEHSLLNIEKQKRSFGDVNWRDPEKAMARKGAYRALRDLTEEKLAMEAPHLQQQFTENKKLYGLLDPIQEAAEKRALQLNQHPVLGLNDIASLGTGGIIGSQYGRSPLGAIAGLIGRRVIGPRVKPTLAVLENAAASATKPLGLIPKEAAKRAATASSASVKRLMDEVLSE